MTRPLKVALIVGARPNFMKAAPLAWQAATRTDVVLSIVHTGQHYDRNMSDLFFEELRIPDPDVNLGVGPGSHAVQTAEIMVRFEKHVLEHRPDVVCVVGDVNSTIACALVAAKLGIKVAHVEAGLRSFDRAMPEEINRVLTDSISDILFVTEQSGADNLKHEGVPDEKVHFVGNVMIDTLIKSRDLAEKSTILERLGLAGVRYGIVTLHRPSNVDDKATLTGIWSALEVVSREMALVFPVHPRTRQKIADFGLTVPPGIRLLDPAGYLDFLKLQASAALILTDSGGVQEEATILEVPCLTLRDNTERPVTIQVGCNKLVGSKPEKILEAALAIVRGNAAKPRVPKYWDGCAADRILDILVRTFGKE